jgi:hypothetical protein
MAFFFLTACAVILFALSQLQNVLIPESIRPSEVSRSPKSSDIEKKADSSVVKKPKDVKEDQAKDETPVQNNGDVVDKQSQTVDTPSDNSSSTEKAIKTTPTKNKETKKDVDKSTKAQ